MGYLYDLSGVLRGIIEIEYLKALKDQSAVQWIKNGISSTTSVSPADDGR